MLGRQCRRTARIFCAPPNKHLQSKREQKWKFLLQTQIEIRECLLEDLQNREKAIEVFYRYVQKDWVWINIGPEAFNQDWDTARQVAEKSAFETKRLKNARQAVIDD